MELDDAALELAHRMFDVARDGGTEELVAYVDAGLPVNLTDPKGDTFLILAAYYDHPETVSALLARGADPARTNDRGQTALAAATFKHSAESVTALLAAGADPAQGSPSALATAEFFELPDMLELLRRPSAPAGSSPHISTAQLPADQRKPASADIRNEPPAGDTS